MVFKLQQSNHKSLLKITIFGTLSIIFLLLFIFGLINNSNGAVKRYDALIAVDKAGGDVDGALNELRSYIYSHMNTEIGGPNGIYPPIQLSGTYERLVKAEEERVSNNNSTLEPDAIAYCEAQNPQGFSGSFRLDCIEKYKDEKGTKLQTIDDSFYKYDFVAPRWSADLAGISLVGFIVFSLISLFYILSYFRTKHQVHIGN